MERIEVNVQTGETKVIPLTAEEIAEAQAKYAEWAVGEETRKQEQIAQLEAQLASLKGAA
jgi:hypothetical protein